MSVERDLIRREMLRVERAGSRQCNARYPNVYSPDAYVYCTREYGHRDAHCATGCLPACILAAWSNDLDEVDEAEPRT